MIKFVFVKVEKNCEGFHLHVRTIFRIRERLWLLLFYLRAGLKYKFGIKLRTLQPVTFIQEAVWTLQTVQCLELRIIVTSAGRETVIDWLTIKYTSNHTDLAN